MKCVNEVGKTRYSVIREDLDQLVMTLCRFHCGVDEVCSSPSGIGV